MPSMIAGCVSVSRSLLPLTSRGQVAEALAAIGSLVELVALDHRAHGAIEHDNALLEKLAQRGDAGGAF